MILMCLTFAKLCQINLTLHNYHSAIGSSVAKKVELNMYLIEQCVFSVPLLTEIVRHFTEYIYWLPR